jgi:hypothetical protein
MSHRYFGQVVHVTGAGGVVVERLDGLGRVYVPSAQTALAGVRLAVDDKVELSIFRGRGFNVMLATRSGERHRVLAAV